VKLQLFSIRKVNKRIKWRNLREFFCFCEHAIQVLFTSNIVFILNFAAKVIFFLKNYNWFKSYKKNKPMAPTIRERGLPICGLRPYYVCEVSRWFFQLRIYIGHSRHGLFFTRWIINTMLNLLKRTMMGFEPGTIGLAVSIANHYTI
jgi:hypothetical protein